MQHPALQSPPRLFLFTGICLLVALTVVICQWELVPVSAGLLLLDGLLFGCLFGVLSLLLWYVIRFADLSGTYNTQKIINYSALVLLVIVAWVGLGYLLLQLLFPNDAFDLLVKSIPLKIVLGIFLFTFVIRLYLKISLSDDYAEDNQDHAPEKTDIHQPEAQIAEVNTAQTIKWAEKISVKVGQKIHVIAVTDILFLQAEGDYVMIHTASGHYIKEQTMKYFDENLSPDKFVRVHRSSIVNVDVISRIELYEKQYYRITLKSGHQLKASASGYKLLKSTLQL